jgi:hypothetical protein
MSAIFITKNGEELKRTRCEIYTRVMWYHRPVVSFNIGKKAEFYSRTYFKWSEANKDFIRQFK